MSAGVSNYVINSILLSFHRTGLESVQFYSEVSLGRLRFVLRVQVHPRYLSLSRMPDLVRREKFSRHLLIRLSARALNSIGNSSEWLLSSLPSDVILFSTTRAPGGSSGWSERETRRRRREPRTFYAVQRTEVVTLPMQCGWRWSFRRWRWCCWWWQ